MLVVGKGMAKARRLGISSTGQEESALLVFAEGAFVVEMQQAELRRVCTHPGRECEIGHVACQRNPIIDTLFDSAAWLVQI